MSSRTTPPPSSDPAAPAIRYAEKPLIYSCSGCSSAAQLANHLALRLDHAGEAEMSCIVGLGGDVKPLVRTAQNAATAGRPIVMIDGCPLQCGRHTLARHGVTPDLHWDLSRLAVAKTKHVDFDPADAARLEPALALAIKSLGCCPPPAPARGDAAQKRSAGKEETWTR